jgi:predicted SAM-dependent methyltransferase
LAACSTRNARTAITAKIRALPKQFHDGFASMRLHIGGTQPADGWEILNVLPGPAVKYIGDIRDLSQFAADSCTDVYASHVLEHVPQAHVVDTLKGIHRILRSGARLMVSVPDMNILCHLFINPLAPLEVKFHVMRMMFGGQVDAHDFHFIGFNEQFLTHFFREAGFASAQRVESFGLFNDTSEFKPYGFPISLNMIAIK